jgi:hypothetical protein
MIPIIVVRRHIKTMRCRTDDLNTLFIVCIRREEKKFPRAVTRRDVAPCSILCINIRLTLLRIDGGGETSCNRFVKKKKNFKTIKTPLHACQYTVEGYYHRYRSHETLYHLPRLCYCYYLWSVGARARSGNTKSVMWRGGRAPAGWREAACVHIKIVDCWWSSPAATVDPAVVRPVDRGTKRNNVRVTSSPFVASAPLPARIDSVPTCTSPPSSCTYA